MLLLCVQKKALEFGCDGVVSSPLEASILRKKFGSDFFIITPGIRPTLKRQNDDQKRIATPKQAILNGADHIVIGRPISASENPLSVIQKIQKEIENFTKTNYSKFSKTNYSKFLK